MFLYWHLRADCRGKVCIQLQLLHCHMSQECIPRSIYRESNLRKTQTQHIKSKNNNTRTTTEKSFKKQISDNDCNVSKKKATGIKTTARSRSMKRNLDTGVEVCDNKVKKKQRHTTNGKPNIHLDIFNESQYFGVSDRSSLEFNVPCSIPQNGR